MNYLKYIELSAENLQFYLWLQDYTKRFEQLPSNEKALSPEWKENIDDVPPPAPNLSSQQEHDAITVDEPWLGSSNELYSKSVYSEKEDPFRTTTISAQDGAENCSETTIVVDHTHMKHLKKVEKAFNGGAVKLQPCMFSKILVVTIKPDES